MPMSFPDMRSLRFAATIHAFRQPEDNESEADFRAALANHVTPRDRIEGHEIRTGKGWHDWDEQENAALFHHH